MEWLRYTHVTVELRGVHSWYWYNVLCSPSLLMSLAFLSIITFSCLILILKLHLSKFDFMKVGDVYSTLLTYELDSFPRLYVSSVFTWFPTKDLNALPPSIQESPLSTWNIYYTFWGHTTRVGVAKELPLLALCVITYAIMPTSTFRDHWYMFKAPQKLQAVTINANQQRGEFRGFSRIKMEWLQYTHVTVELRGVHSWYW